MMYLKMKCFKDLIAQPEPFLGQFFEKNCFPLGEAMSSTPLLQTYCSHHSLLMDHGSIIIILVPLGPLFHKCSCLTWSTCICTIMPLGFRPRSVNFMFKCLFSIPFYFSFLIYYPKINVE